MNDDKTGAFDSGAANLVRQLARVRELHEVRARDPALQSRLKDLSRWQTARVLQTYADFERERRYRPAVEFFVDDLYGPHDFSRRDADLERIAPMMRSILPARVMQTIACSIELNALTAELDIDLLGRLEPAPGGAAIDVARYCRAYRSSARLPDRRRQIDLIDAIGRALEHYVRMPLIARALRMMRFPARMVGVSELHAFLEEGFTAFSALGDAGAFLDTIVRRETELMDRILAGDDAPFPEPPLVR